MPDTDGSCCNHAHKKTPFFNRKKTTKKPFPDHKNNDLRMMFSGLSIQNIEEKRQ